MYQLHFTQKKLWEKEAPVAPLPSRLPRRDVAATMLLNWEEHDLECAPADPSSPSYCPRGDGENTHFVYGIYPNRAFSGLFPFGADIRFRPWGKIEADLRQSNFSIAGFWHRLLQRLIALSPRMMFLLFRLRWLRRMLDFKPQTGEYDEFVVECFSAEKNSFQLIFEGYEPLAAGKREVKFRHSFAISPGHNLFRVPASTLPLHGARYIYLYPDNAGREARLIFTWLDFVKYRRRGKIAPLVKCVAWDLDNTLWDGILAETRSPDELAVHPRVRETILNLDRHGIIQTIVSKNDFEAAWKIIEREKLQDYFIFPAINWGQKSENLKAVAKKINIGLDTFAFIDDSDFERAEVAAALPQVRVYHPSQLSELLNYPEFQAPVTEESGKRRQSYLAEMQRERIRAAYSGNYEDFLRSLEMRIEIFTPSGDAETARCFELAARSNQLNISGRRFGKAEFAALLADRHRLNLAFRARDKFGDYGIVAFASVDESDAQSAVITDLVISCRVAQRKAEETFMEWLMDYYAAHGRRELVVRFVATERNAPMGEVLKGLPFVAESASEGAVFRAALGQPMPRKAYMEVESHVH